MGDVVHNLSKKEKEDAKVLRKKNQTRLANILDQMTKVDHRTTWEQCQQMLLDNPAFADDDELLSKDKERIKEETKKLRKLEGDLRGVFTEINVEETSSWTEVMAKIQDKEAFSAVTEAQAEKMFKDYQKDLGETCLHN